MKVIIEGDSLAQVRDGCMAVAHAIKPPPPSLSADYLRRRYKKQRKESELNRTNRVIIKLAFDLIRCDPKQKKMVNALARALGGSAPVTDELLAAAHQIIAANQ